MVGLSACFWPQNRKALPSILAAKLYLNINIKIQFWPQNRKALPSTLAETVGTKLLY
jgi:hypothetical protein